MREGKPPFEKKSQIKLVITLISVYGEPHVINHQGDQNRLGKKALN